MESKKIDRLNYRLEMLDHDIEESSKRLEALTSELKEAVAKYDTYQIVVFVPGYVRQIEELNNEIRGMKEQRRILMWIDKEDDNA